MHSKRTIEVQGPLKVLDVLEYANGRKLLVFSDATLLKSSDSLDLVTAAQYEAVLEWRNNGRKCVPLTDEQKNYLNKYCPEDYPREQTK